MSVDWTLVIIVIAFICLDIISGLLKALYNKNLQSVYARQGLFHKIGEILALTVGYFLEYAESYLNIGFEIPIFKGIAIYITIMECISVIENLCEINPHLNKLFSKYLYKLKEKEGTDIEKRN